MKIYTVSVFLFLYFSSLLVPLPGKTCSNLKERDAQKVFTNFLINLSFRSFHVIGVCLSSQSAPEKKTIKIKAHIPLRTSWISPKKNAFDNQTIYPLFWLFNKQTFHMPSLRDLRFVFCSLDLDVRRAQRIIGFFILPTNQRGREIRTHGQVLEGKLKQKVTTILLLCCFLFDSSTALGNSRERNGTMSRDWWKCGFFALVQNSVQQNPRLYCKLNLWISKN